MRDLLKHLFEKNGKAKEHYAQKVNELIRVRYTVADEFALLRQREEKPEEYAEYNAYCEECKAAAKLWVYGE